MKVHRESLSRSSSSKPFSENIQLYSSTGTVTWSEISSICIFDLTNLTSTHTLIIAQNSTTVPCPVTSFYSIEAYNYILTSDLSNDNHFKSRITPKRLASCEILQFFLYFSVECMLSQVKKNLPVKGEMPL